MTRQWIPRKDEFVVLDTDIIINLRQKNDYKKPLAEVIDKIKAGGVHIIIPQIVECELIRNARDAQEFQETQLFVSEYISWPTKPEILNTACKIQAMYCWNEGTKDHGQKNIFNDMIVGAIAGYQEIDTKKSTYILSCNQDFRSPYFEECHKIPLHCSSGKRILYIHYYRSKRRIISRDWNEYQKSIVSMKKTT